ncbi:Hsp20/alpha crystallin family protein [Kitasatospora sp. NPDC056446]|uniref:Hsp20/alpha crystallin family protein n=1 Tax=Kitasatospora sp. NPDC056446 TaxID=3345819 RepID=UPI00368AD44C
MFVLRLDLPGIDPQSIDLAVGRNVLTVRAERASGLPQGAEVLVDERVLGRIPRQVFLGDARDADRIEADHGQGVVRVPISEKARPRKIAITVGRTRGHLRLTPAARLGRSFPVPAAPTGRRPLPGVAR